MVVRNVDGPGVTVVINGQAIADLPCNAGPIAIRPGVNEPYWVPWRPR
jgi:hypothetical protein